MVTSSVIAVVVFVAMFGGALFGMFLRPRLPEQHLAKDTEDAVRLGLGVIATMTALVVGLLLASAKTARDGTERELKLFAADLVLLDRNLAQYGPETAAARELLRRYTVHKIAAMWPNEAAGVVVDPAGWRLLEEVQEKVRTLTPATASQRFVQPRALQISGEVAQTRWLLNEQVGSVPVPFLLVVASWLAIIFTSCGVFAPRNHVVITVLFFCALSIAGALFLILDMAQPFQGFVRVSSISLRNALAMLGQ
jgi:hypothetical protein